MFLDLDDEDDVFAQTKRKKGTIDVLLRSASARLKNIDEPGVRKAEPRQKTLKGMFSGAKEKVGKAVGKFFFAHGIPAHVATEPCLQHMVDVIGESGRGIKAPTAYELKHKYLPEQKKELEQWVKEQNILWAEYGVTLMCDGWTSGNRKQIINFLAHCCGSTIFLDSVDASGEVKEYSYLYKLMKKYMKVVGPENIVQIVTDNGSNFKKAGGKIMKNSPVYWTPCAAHCIDLILKDMGKLEYIKSVTIDAKLITGFIYNHSFLLNAMRRPKYCGGDLVRVGVTRFATNYLALDSLKNKRDGLKRLFNGVEWTSMKEHNTPLGRRIEELIANRAFWDKVTKVLKVMAPIVKVLRLVDGDKAATMPWLYAAMETMVENVKKAAPTSNAQYMSIIKKRWTDMLLHPLHKVAYYLNPRYHYSRQLGMKPDLMNAVRDVLNKVLTSTEERMQVLDQDMIENVLEIKDTHVREVMTPLVDVIAIDASAKLIDFQKLWLNYQYSRVPVFEQRIDNIVGIAFAKDMLEFVEQFEKLENSSVGDIAQKPAYFVPDSMSVWNLLREFRIRKVHMAVVLNEYGGTVGIVTLEDVVEEIVGEIFDENDSKEEIQKKTGGVITLKDGSFRVDANTSMDQLSEELNVKIPEGHQYETVSGFICEAFGCIPNKGKKIMVLLEKGNEEENTEYNDTESDNQELRIKNLMFELEILEANERKVEFVLFRPVADPTTKVPKKRKRIIRETDRSDNDDARAFLEPVENGDDFESPLHDELTNCVVIDEQADDLVNNKQ